MTNELRENIEKFDIGLYSYNPQTKEKGEFLRVEKSKKLSQNDISFIRNNKQALIEEIKKMREEKKEKEKIEYEKKIKKEKEKYITNNEKITIGLFFTNYGEALYGLPDFLKEKESVLLTAYNRYKLISFPMDWEGFLPIEITYSEIIEIEKKVKELETERKERNETKKKAHYDKCLAEAKQKNKKVVLEQYSDECNDPNEECDIDIIVTYLYPDGSKETIRDHTW